MQRRIRWNRVGWLLPFAVAASWMAATSTPTLLTAAREHQVRAYLEAPPLQPVDWRPAPQEPLRFERLTGTE